LAFKNGDNEDEEEEVEDDVGVKEPMVGLFEVRIGEDTSTLGGVLGSSGFTRTNNSSPATNTLPLLSRFDSRVVAEGRRMITDRPPLGR